MCDKKRWKLYKSQESPATRGVHFITAEELKVGNVGVSRH